MFTDDQIRSLPGADVYNDAGFKVGAVSKVWADTAGHPSWSVSTPTRLDSAPSSKVMPSRVEQVIRGRRE